jgi:hypothetical protein
MEYWSVGVMECCRSELHSPEIEDAEASYSGTPDAQRAADAVG